MRAIRIGPSRTLALLIAGMHGAGGWFAWLALPAWLTGLLALPLLGSLWFYLRRDCLRTAPGSVVGFEIHPDCRCAVQTRHGDWLEARLLPSSFVAPYLTVLNLRVAGRRFPAHVTILPDAIDGEDFRRLRVLLRWKCSGAA
jgi:toxin CptA